MYHPPMRPPGNVPLPVRHLPAAVAFAAVVFAQGCVSQSRDPAMREPVTPTATATSTEQLPAAPSPKPVELPPPPAPVPMAQHRALRLEVSALSQVNRSNPTKPTLDLRIDALDNLGAPARAAGALRIVVEGAGAEPAACVFNISMATQADEAKLYDTVIEQYVVRLAPTWKKLPAAGADISVALELTPPTGEPLKATGLLRW
ncbi:MAG: hypothetical protein ACO3QC_05235 [Phycisphaerales bacterium]